METTDCIVIGAGVVGLACARKLALEGRRVLVLESEPAIGAHTSSHNSGVIHAGLYHPPETLKGRLCVQGKRLLYRYLEANEVPHRRSGKLVVAPNRDEEPALERMETQARACGVDDLVWLSGREVREREPNLRAAAALWSPSSGIVDPVALMRAFARDIESAGGEICLNTPITRGRIDDGHIELTTDAGESRSFRAASVINAAGLRAPQVGRAIEGPHQEHVPEGHFALGHYFALRTPVNFQHLVYPVAAPGFAHIHLTFTMSGKVRFGPDIAWVERPQYAFQEGRAEAFYRAIRRYYPALADGDLVEDGVGVRPKLSAAGAPRADFVIQGERVHGVSGLVNLFGIESPGLTACLAIADEVVEKLL